MFSTPNGWCLRKELAISADETYTRHSKRELVVLGTLRKGNRNDREKQEAW